MPRSILLPQTSSSEQRHENAHLGHRFPTSLASACTGRRTSEVEFSLDMIDQGDLDPKHLQRLRSALVSWGRKNFTNFPWRHTENRFHALVAELLLQRTRADQVLPVYEEFVRLYPVPQSLAASPPEHLAEMMQPLGLHWRIPLLLELGEKLAEAGGVPTDRRGLLALPGVGPYAASALLSLHVRVRCAIVDSNVVRLYSRLFGFQFDGETRRKKWFLQVAEKVTPARVFRDFNYALLDLTRAICRPKPLCEECAIRKLCRFGTERVGPRSDT